MNKLLLTIKKTAILIVGIFLTHCNQAPDNSLETVLENYIRQLPKHEKKSFQNYRRIWLYLATTFANGDLPTHKDFDSLFQYNRNEEKFLLKTMLVKDSVWNVHAIKLLDTLVKLQYQQNNYQSYGLNIAFHQTETDSGSPQVSRYKGLIHYSNTSKYVQKEFFSKYVHEIYPIPLMLDFTMPKKSPSFFCVDFEEVQVLDSIYNEFHFQILHHIRWFSEPLMDTLLFKKFIPQKEKNILLQEYYKIVQLQQMCGMPEEDWQHRSVRPVVDAFILIIAKQLFNHPTVWKDTGLNYDLIHLGLTTMANQWFNMSPWLHHYITSSLQNIFQYYYPDSKIVIKLPSGKSSIRRKCNAEPILIAPIKVLYAHPHQTIQEFWISLPILKSAYPKFNLLKIKKWNVKKGD